MTVLTFYAPSFIDESLTFPDKRGHQQPTGRQGGMVITRRFFKTRAGRIKAERSIVPFSWSEPTQEAKVNALAKAIAGMDELPGLDENPPLNWIPPLVKEKLA